MPQELHNDERIHNILVAVLKEASIPELPIKMVPKPGASIGLDDEGRVLIPVVAASRAHSDITAAIAKAKLSKWGFSCR